MYRTAPYSATLDDRIIDLKVTPSFDAEYLWNGTRYRRSFSGILGLTCALLNGVISNDLEWPWV